MLGLKAPASGSELRARGYEAGARMGSGQFGYAVLVTKACPSGAPESRTYVAKLQKFRHLPSEDKERMQREVDAMRTLAEAGHPYLVRFRESFVEGDKLCIIMDYCDSGDLAVRIKRQREVGHGQQFPEAQVQRWLAQLIAGLDFLHAMHVLHRDIKPSSERLPPATLARADPSDTNDSPARRNRPLTRSLHRSHAREIARTSSRVVSRPRTPPTYAHASAASASHRDKCRNAASTRRDSGGTSRARTSRANASNGFSSSVSSNAAFASPRAAARDDEKNRRRRFATTRASRLATSTRDRAGATARDARPATAAARAAARGGMRGRARGELRRSSLVVGRSVENGRRERRRSRRRARRHQASASRRDQSRRRGGGKTRRIVAGARESARFRMIRRMR